MSCWYQVTYETIQKHVKTLIYGSGPIWASRFDNLNCQYLPHTSTDLDEIFYIVLVIVSSLKWRKKLSQNILNLVAPSGVIHWSHELKAAIMQNK